MPLIRIPRLDAETASKGPQVEPLPDGENWLILANYPYSVQVEDLTISGTVQKGFEFDFGSIPRFAWWIVGAPATGKHRNASVIHDWLYVKQRALINGVKSNVTKKIADRVFYVRMKEDGVIGWKAWVMWRAVSWFGQGEWDD